MNCTRVQWGKHERANTGNWDWNNFHARSASNWEFLKGSNHVKGHTDLHLDKPPFGEILCILQPLRGYEHRGILDLEGRNLEEGVLAVTQDAPPLRGRKAGEGGSERGIPVVENILHGSSTCLTAPFLLVPELLVLRLAVGVSGSSYR